MLKANIWSSLVKDSPWDSTLMMALYEELALLFEASDMLSFKASNMLSFDVSSFDVSSFKASDMLRRFQSMGSAAYTHTLMCSYIGPYIYLIYST